MSNWGPSSKFIIIRLLFIRMTLLSLLILTMHRTLATGESRVGLSSLTSSLSFCGRASVLRNPQVWERLLVRSSDFFFCPTLVLKRIVFHKQPQTASHALSWENKFKLIIIQSQDVVRRREFPKHPLSCHLATSNQPSHGGLTSSTNSPFPRISFSLPTIQCIFLDQSLGGSALTSYLDSCWTGSDI